jgi:hypothetical protein
VESVRMLGEFQKNESGLAKLRMSGMVPLGIAGDGTLVASTAIDYAYWDKTSAELAQRKELSAKRRILLVAGAASERAERELEKAGWMLRSEIARPRDESPIR